MTLAEKVAQLSAKAGFGMYDVTPTRDVVPNEKLVRTVNASGYGGWYTLENPVGDTFEDTVRQISVLKSWLSGK